MITVELFDEYVKQLASHDWAYDYSDDHGVWRRGEAKHKELVAQAKTHQQYQKAFNVWGSYQWGTTGTWESRKKDRDQAIQLLREQIQLGVVK